MNYVVAGLVFLASCGVPVANQTDNSYEPAKRGTQVPIERPPEGACFYNGVAYPEGSYEIVEDGMGSTENHMLFCRPFIVEIATPPTVPFYVEAPTTVSGLPETK